VDPAETVDILLAYRAGATMADLAKDHCLQRKSVSALLRRAGVPIRPRRLPSEAVIKEAMRLYEQGWSLARIGDRLEFDHQTIRRHLMLRGVVMRSPNQRQADRR
jgi:DNA-binding CsgD family transcriptional regulator